MIGSRGAVWIISVGRSERKDRFNCFASFSCRNDSRSVPCVSGIKRHVFDKSHLHAKSASKSSKFDGFIIVDAAHKHCIQLQWCQSFCDAHFNSTHDIIRRGCRTCHLSKSIAANRINTDGNAIKACAFPARKFFARKQRTIRDHRNLDTARLTNARNDLFKLWMQRGFASGHANLSHSK